MNKSFTRAAAAAAMLTMMSAGVSAAEGTTVLDEVVVTATRTEETLRNVPAATEVITQKDMKRLGAQDIRSALKLATNVDVTEAGMTGNQVSIRGMTSSHTLLLIDGRRMAAEDTDQTTNAYELNRINLSNVDRIEIVRGASSALYGSDALGGVINIITKKPADPGWVVGANTGTRQSNAYWHYDMGQQGKFNGSFDVNFQKVRKFSWDDSKDTTMYGPRQNFAFDGEYTLSKGRTIGMNLEYMKDHMRMGYENGKYAQEKYQLIDSERKSAALDYHVKTDASDFMVRAYYNRLDKDNTTYNKIELYSPMPGIMPPVFVRPLPNHKVFDFDRAKYDTFVFETRDTTKLNDAHRLTVGGEYRYLKYQGTRLNRSGQNPTDITIDGVTRTRSEEEMNFAAAYVQDEWTPNDKLILLPSVRYDYSDKFGSNVAPKIGLTYKFKENLRFKANYGRGFRAPTLSELYMYFDGSSMAGMPGANMFYISGNPNLQPEKSLGYDFALEGEYGKAFASASYFHNKVNNLISTREIAGSDPQINQYYNVGKAKLEGVETAVGYHLNDRWTLKGTWNYLDAMDETENTKLDGRASHYGTVQVLYDDEDSNGVSGVLWFQYTRDYLWNKKSYTYNTWNISVNKKWSEHISTFVGVDNIFDKDLNDVYVGGRMWRTGIEWSF